MTYGPMVSEEDILKAYDEHCDALFRHCQIRIADRETSKELIAETFRKVWLFVSRGNVVDSMKIFLYRELNALIEQEAKEEVVLPTAPTFFKELSRQDRVVYLLHYVDSFSSDEITKIIGGTTETHGATLRSIQHSLVPAHV